MKNIKRKGFTLVELLIVIVVIGILSAMMMLSSTEAVTSARASNIVSNLRNFKTAAMAMYVDYLDNMDQCKTPENKDTAFPTTFAAGTQSDQDKILVKYMNKGDSNTGDTDTDHYHIVLGTATINSKSMKAYYVMYDNASDSRVQEKLVGRAASVGLLKAAATTGTATDDVYAKGSNNVYMFVTATSIAADSGGNGGNG